MVFGGSICHSSYWHIWYQYCCSLLRIILSFLALLLPIWWGYFNDSPTRNPQDDPKNERFERVGGRGVASRNRASAATDNTPTLGKFHCIVKDSMDGSAFFFFFFGSFILGYGALKPSGTFTSMRSLSLSTCITLTGQSTYLLSLLVADSWFHFPIPWSGCSGLQ